MWNKFKLMVYAAHDNPGCLVAIVPFSFGLSAVDSF